MSEELKNHISKIISTQYRNGRKVWCDGKKLTNEHRKNMSLAWNYNKHMTPAFIASQFTKEKIIGEKNPMWRGGVTPEMNKIRNSPEMRQWRKLIFDRDNFTCQSCDKRGGNLEADHLIPFAHDPSKRLDIENGITLCKDCHKLTPTYANNLAIYACE